jgi:hypothetical protein
MGFRQKHLEQFTGLPEQIWAAHRRVAAALDATATEQDLERIGGPAMTELTPRRALELSGRDSDGAHPR